MTGSAVAVAVALPAADSMLPANLTAEPIRATRTALVLAAHGSSDPAHRRIVLGLRDLVRAATGAGNALRRTAASGKAGATDAPIAVEVGWLDHGDPSLADRLDSLGADAVVVVPLLLAAGFHVRVDIPATIARAAGSSTSTASTTRPIGPDPLLAQVLDRRLDEAGAGPGQRIVLAAAGSNEPAALGDVTRVATMLSARRGVRVDVGYVTGSGPRLGDVMSATHRRTGGRAAVATYLLSPGRMADAVRTAAGAHLVSSPLGAAPELAELVIRRWDEIAGQARLSEPNSKP
jgi:sirohydrochlorin ferrochelatase